MWFNRRRDPRIRDEIQFPSRPSDRGLRGRRHEPQEAERRAFLEFGNAAQIEEAVSGRPRAAGWTISGATSATRSERSAVAAGSPQWPCSRSPSGSARMPPSSA